MDPFIVQLCALCTAQPTRAKWVFVATHALRRTLGDRLVLEGTDWANLHNAASIRLKKDLGPR